MKDWLFFVLILMACGVVVSILVSAFLGCGPALEVYDDVQQKALDGIGCEPETSKCQGSSLLYCRADHTWQENAKCPDYRPARACCEGPKGPGCQRPEDCEEDRKP